MDAYFFTFSKRENSTKQPVLNTGNKAEIILKAPTSILNPVIELDLGIAAAPSTTNYMYIPDFGRYYWLTSPGWVWENRKWIGYFTVDPLASWKTGIGTTTSYVARSASSYDGNIIDSYYPGKAVATYSCETLMAGGSADQIFTDTISNGRFIVGIQGDTPGTYGGSVSYYVMTQDQLYALVHELLDNYDYSVNDISSQLLECIFNPLQYIVSCMWVPFIPTTVGTTSSLKFGWWSITLTGQSIEKLPDKPVWTSGNKYIDIPTHPQAATRGNYLNVAPFSEYYLSAGPFGIIPLTDGYKAAGKTSVMFYVKVDMITGSGRLEVYAPDAVNGVLSICTAQIGVPIQLGQNVLNQGAITSMTSSAAGAIQSAASLDIQGAVAGVNNYIGDYLASKFPVISSLGSNGSTSFFNVFSIIGKFTEIVDDDIADRGRPLMQVKTINTLSGYVECINPDPQIACSDSELSAIIGYMSRGFFYE